MNYDIFDKYKIDYKADADRSMGDEKMLCMVRTAFFSDDTFARTKAAYESGDAEQRFRTAHELKGVSGNTSLTGLYEACGPQGEYLRAGGGNKGELERLFAAVAAAREWVCEGISLSLA